MKQLIMLMLILVSGTILAQSNSRTTTYNYQAGNLQVNTITYYVNITIDNISVRNVSNTLNTTLRNHPDVDCADANFNQAGITSIENVFRQVFPVARRRAFATIKGATNYEIYASESGQVQEVSFYFKRGNPITPQEMYQLEVGFLPLLVF